MIIQFATNSYQSLSLPLSAQRCVNFYAEKEPPDAKSQVALFGSPGLVSFGTVGSGPIRGMHVMNGVLYVVSGGNLYSVSSTGVGTLLGGTIGGSAFTPMADNGSQLCIVNGVNGYVWNSATGFAIIADFNFHPANTVTFFDNVFVFDWTTTAKFFISNVLDGLTYNGLGFASAEVALAPVLATINQQETLLIFTTKTIETWYDAGSPIFPFQRVDGGTIERGAAGSYTPIKEDNSVFFLGDDLIFYRLNGITLQRVSTHAIEAAWQKYTTCADAFTFSYTFDGHKFLALTFPTANVTWHFDIATGLWHERESWDINNNTYGRWRGNCSAEAYGKVLIGDAFTGVIGYLDANTYTEYGNTMRGLAIGTTINADRKRMGVTRLELDMQAGVGVTSGQGSDPQAMLEWSRDGGVTFGGLQTWNSIGAIGAYLTRLRWLKQGQGRQMTPRLTISDPVRRVVIAASADVWQGL